MTFLHWSFEPAVVDRLLPPGLIPDLHDGKAWVGLTPFCVEGFRLPFTPPVPGLSTFPEANLRTYVQGPHGDGLWFLSLEVASIATVLGARLGYGVPYRLAQMCVEPGATVHYSSQRGDVGFDITINPGEPCAPADTTEFDHWLTGRWRAYTHLAGRLASVAVEHQPWPLQRGEVVSLDENLLSSCRLPAPTEPPLVHCSSGVDAKLSAPRFA